ncbi:hypothetical protein DV515_00019545, partial [Chloebia gouldiae]
RAEPRQRRRGGSGAAPGATPGPFPLHRSAGAAEKRTAGTGRGGGTGIPPLLNPFTAAGVTGRGPRAPLFPLLGSRYRQPPEKRRRTIEDFNKFCSFVLAYAGYIPAAAEGTGGYRELPGRQREGRGGAGRDRGGNGRAAKACGRYRGGHRANTGSCREVPEGHRAGGLARGVPGPPPPPPPPPSPPAPPPPRRRPGGSRRAPRGPRVIDSALNPAPPSLSANRVAIRPKPRPQREAPRGGKRRPFVGNQWRRDLHGHALCASRRMLGGVGGARDGDYKSRRALRGGAMLRRGFVLGGGYVGVLMGGLGWFGGFWGEFGGPELHFGVNLRFLGWILGLWGEFGVPGSEFEVPRLDFGVSLRFLVWGSRSDFGVSLGFLVGLWGEFGVPGLDSGASL